MLTFNSSATLIPSLHFFPLINHRHELLHTFCRFCGDFNVHIGFHGRLYRCFFLVKLIKRCFLIFFFNKIHMVQRKQKSICQFEGTPSVAKSIAYQSTEAYNRRTKRHITYRKRSELTKQSKNNTNISPARISRSFRQLHISSAICMLNKDDLPKHFLSLAELTTTKKNNIEMSLSPNLITFMRYKWQ